MNKEGIFESGYDAEEDVLYIYSRKGKAKESVEVAEDIILDTDLDNNLVGIEILYASEFFEALNSRLDKKILGNMKEVKVVLKEYRNMLIIVLGFKVNNEIIEEKLPALSLKQYESPLVASVG